MVVACLGFGSRPSFGGHLPTVLPEDTSPGSGCPTSFCQFEAVIHFARLKVVGDKPLLCYDEKSTTSWAPSLSKSWP